MDLDTARKEMTQTLEGIKAAASENGGKIANIEQAMADFQTSMRNLQAAQEAHVSASYASRSGSSSELAAYLPSQDEYAGYADTRSYEGSNKAFYASDNGAVQLLSAEKTYQHNGKTHKYFSWGLLDDPNPRTEWQREVQRAVQTRSIVRSLLHPSRRFTPRSDSDVVGLLRSGPEQVSRIFADSAGIGAEWIPDTTLPELERDVIAPVNFTGVFDMRDVGPGGTLKLPYRSGYLRVYQHAVPTADNPADDVLSSWTTAERTIDPVPSACAVQADRDAVEDSIIPIVPEVTQDIVNAFRYANDDTWTNGDTTATHQDAIADWDPRGRLGGTTGLGGGNDHRRRWLGLRAFCADISQTTDLNASQTAAGLLTIITQLGMEHLIESNGIARVVIAVSPEYFFKTMLTWDEFETFDKVGVLASVLTGTLGNPAGTPGGLLPNQVGFLWGRFPVVLNYTISGDMNASGVFDNVTTTKTGLLVFDRTRFQTWRRQGMSLEGETNIRNNTITWVARERLVGRSKDTVASSPTTAHYAYNLTA